MNEATERWEYDNPPSTVADSVSEAPCPRCGGELQRQDRENYACLACDAGLSAAKNGAGDRTTLYNEWGHPVAEVIVKHESPD